MNVLRSGLLIALLAGAGLPGFAQTDDQDAACTTDLAPERLLGDYKVAGSAFKANFGGVPSVVDRADTGTASIVTGEMGGYVLADFHPKEPLIPLSLAGPTEEPWYWSQQDMIDVGLSSSDVELIQGCKVVEMTRLIGTFNTVSEDGYPIRHTLRLMVWGDGWIFGAHLMESETAQGAVSMVQSLNMERE